MSKKKSRAAKQKKYRFGKLKKIDISKIRVYGVENDPGGGTATSTFN